MQIYLPIAALPVDAYSIAGLSVSVGFVSGFFGVGGGFLMAPLMMFLGIPPAVAVASASSQIVAASTTGALNFWRHRTIDFKLSAVLTIGGIAGVLPGVMFFNAMLWRGHLDTIVHSSYIVLLSAIGCWMLICGPRAIFPMSALAGNAQPEVRYHRWIASLPLKIEFPHSGAIISLVPALLFAACAGFLGAMLGIGGGFILIPVLLYLFRVPAAVVVGTVLIQQLIVMIVATFLHAVTDHSVDILLALILMLGGAFGAQFGAMAQTNMHAKYLPALFGLLFLCVASRFAAGILIPPVDAYSATRTVIPE